MYGDFKLASERWLNWMVANKEQYESWSKLDWLRQDLRENQKSDVTCVCFRGRRVCYSSRKKRPSCKSHDICMKMDRMGCCIFEEQWRQEKTLRETIKHLQAVIDGGLQSDSFALGAQDPSRH